MLNRWPSGVSSVVKRNAVAPPIERWQHVPQPHKGEMTNSPANSSST